MVDDYQRRKEFFDEINEEYITLVVDISRGNPDCFNDLVHGEPSSSEDNEREYFAFSVSHCISRLG